MAPPARQGSRASSALPLMSSRTSFGQARPYRFRKICSYSPWVKAGSSNALTSSGLVGRPWKLNHQKLCSCSETQDIFSPFSIQIDNTCRVINWLYFLPPLHVAGSPGTIPVLSLKCFQCRMAAFPPGTQLGWHSLRAANLEGSGSLEGQHELAYGQVQYNMVLSNQKQLSPLHLARSSLGFLELPH